MLSWLRPELLIPRRLRELWEDALIVETEFPSETGRSQIALRTVVQIDGDITSHVHEATLAPDFARLRSRHHDAVERQIHEAREYLQTFVDRLKALGWSVVAASLIAGLRELDLTEWTGLVSIAGISAIHTAIDRSHGRPSQREKLAILVALVIWVFVVQFFDAPPFAGLWSTSSCAAMVLARLWGAELAAFLVRWALKHYLQSRAAAG